MRAIISKLKGKLKATDTEERCGLVLKGNRVIQTPNDHDDPTRGFRIPGAELLAHEDALVGTWHTHPGKTSVYSMEDHFGFMAWPDLTHFIIGTDGVRAYRVAEDIVQEIDLASD